MTALDSKPEPRPATAPSSRPEATVQGSRSPERPATAPRALLATPFVALLLTAPATAQIPMGFELQINTHTTGAQTDPAVAMAADGSFVVVWSSFQGADNDDFNAVNGRRYSATGMPLGADFQVNTYTTESQGSPAIAVAPGGSFVVVWENFEYGGVYPVDDVVNIRARIYDANGNGGADILVNEPPDEAVYHPDVAMDPSGNFIVVWEGSYANSDGSGTAVWGQRFDASGTALGGNFQVNTYTTSHQFDAAVSAGNDGSFVVVWQSFGSDGSSYQVRGRRFAANGNPQGSDFAVNTYPDGPQTAADVAVDPDGGFTIVWESFATPGNDADPFSIQGRRYNAVGNPLGIEFQVNTYTTSGQGKPSIATSSLGPLVVWESSGSAGTDSSLAVNASVQRRAFLPSEQARSDDVQVNTYTPSFQWRPAAAMNESGQVVVVWESLGSAFTDGDGFSIQGQRFLLPIFADGFESGDVTAWSSSSP